jgi:hypothetical protein
VMNVVVRTDYAGNAGGNMSGGIHCETGTMPTSYQQVDGGNFNFPTDRINGITGQGSEYREGDIIDGLSNTYLIGEKNLNPDHYESGQAPDDNEGAYTGFNNDVDRVSDRSFPPLADTPGITSHCSYGSAHNSHFFVAFCDGSVQAISYSVDPITHERLGNREDGLAVDLSKL